jgi:hypothetical protein
VVLQYELNLQERMEQERVRAQLNAANKADVIVCDGYE